MEKCAFNFFNVFKCMVSIRSLVLGLTPQAGKTVLLIKAILSLGAGVDHILSDPDLPEDLPIVRLVDPKLTHEMCFHALHWVLHFHSDHFLYMKQQMDKKWQQQGSIQPEDRTVGIMGLGNIGRGIGDSLVNQGFRVLGWGANQKSSLGDIQHFFGDEQLGDFLEKTDILINVLPLTESTTNILRKQELQRLPRGAFIINMGRGGIVNEADLLSLLDEGHITAAAIDVFEEEPLRQLVVDQQLMMYKHDGFWQPMDTSREYQLLNSLYESGEAPWVR